MALEKENIPKIIQACKEIWYDNGMINRLESEESHIEKLMCYISQANPKMVKIIEDELATKSDDEIHKICCGFDDEQESLASSFVLDFLNIVFNEYVEE